MKKLFKKFAAIGMAAMMIMAMGVTAFAAEDETIKVLDNARFLRDSGEDLPLGMGTGVIVADGSTIDTSTGEIKVQLQPYTRWMIINFTGTIEEAYYILEDGSVDDTVNLVQEETVINEDGSESVFTYLVLDETMAEIMSTGEMGVHLQLTFDMQPMTPPGMNTTMNAYFTCDDIQNES